MSSIRNYFGEIHGSSTDKRVKGEGNTEGPAGVHKVELIMHCTMVDRGNVIRSILPLISPVFDLYKACRVVIPLTH